MNRNEALEQKRRRQERIEAVLRRAASNRQLMADLEAAIADERAGTAEYMPLAELKRRHGL